MKKIATIASIVLIGAMFTSCKKKYTCECTTTTNGTVTATVSSEAQKKTTKKDAENECNQGDSEVTVSGTTVKTECSIK